MSKKHAGETVGIAKGLVKTIMGGASEMEQSNATFHMIGLLRALRDDKRDVAQMELRLLQQIIRRELMGIK